MKQALIVTFVIMAIAITAAHAGSRTPLLAQTEAPQAAPAAAPAEPQKESAIAPPAAAPSEAPKETVTPMPATPPAASPPAPAAVETPRLVPEAKPAASPVQQISQRQDHAGFAKMEVRDCTGCHKASGIAPNHDADWVRGHRLVAGKPDKNCKECHVQSFCLDCHKGGGIDVDLGTGISHRGIAPASHRTDFREIHPIKALDNPQTCGRCHNARFCSECHARFRGEDLRVLSHRKGWSNLQVANPGPAHSTFTTAQCQTCHPGGLLPKHVWSSDHAREARRNLQSCQTCHSDGQVCMTCHSARAGLRINPHPRGWNSVKDGYKKRSDGRSCIKCHDTY